MSEITNLKKKRIGRIYNFNPPLVGETLEIEGQEFKVQESKRVYSSNKNVFKCVFDNPLISIEVLITSALPFKPGI